MIEGLEKVEEIYDPKTPTKHEIAPIYKTIGSYVDNADWV